MTLHQAIEKLLVQQGRSMSTAEIADALNQNGWYTKQDGSPIQPFQIHGRTKNYHELFDRDGSKVSLKSKTRVGKVSFNKKPKASISSISSNPSLAVKVLMNEKNFKKASGLPAL